MLRSIPIIALLALIGLFGTSCQQDTHADQQALQYLSADVDAVAVIRLSNLLEKSNWASIQQSSPFQDILGEIAQEEPKAADIFKDPAASGIDTDADILIVGDLPYSNQNEGYMAMAFQLADRTLLEAQLEEFDVPAQQASNKTGSWENKEVSMAWNDEVFFLVQSEDNPAIKASSFINDPPSNSLADNDNVSQYLKQDFDMGFWVTSNLLAQAVPDSLFEFLPGWSREDLRENYLHGFWRFEDGQMVGEMVPDLKTQLTSDLDLLFRKETKADLSEGLPGEGMVGVLTSSIDLPGMNQLLLEKMVEGGARQQLEDQGIDYNKMIKALSGDVFVATYASHNTPAEQIVFVGGLKDTDQFRELLQDMPTLELVDGLYHLQPEFKTDSLREAQAKGVWLRVFEDRFMMADQADWLKAISLKDNADNAVLQQFRDLRNHHRFAAVMQPDMIGGEDFPADLLGQIYASANSDGIKLVIDLKDKDQNSLETLLRFLGAQSQSGQEL